MQIPTPARKMRFLRDKKGFLLVLEIHDDHSPMPKWFHLGFELPTRDDVRRAAEYFQSQGIELLDPLNDSESLASFTISDPDGYHLQLYWESQ